MVRHGLDPNLPPPPGLVIEPYWRACLDELHVVYGGVCAYLCVFIEREAGGVAVEHYVPKSMSKLRLAYEWSNYRLACDSMNARKLNFDDVMDPFRVKPGMFRLDLVTGAVFSNPGLGAMNRQCVEETIERLHLDNSGRREMRQRHFRNFAQQRWPPDVLQEYSPFVWAEARRQGFL